MMKSNVLGLLLVACLVASVAGSKLLSVRNKRQSDWDLDKLPHAGEDHTGECGAPMVNITHGGIKLFPIDDDDDIDDDSCEILPEWFECQYKFYCDHGYKLEGFVYYQCVHDLLTDEYYWEGTVPTCVEDETVFHADDDFDEFQPDDDIDKFEPKEDFDDFEPSSDQGSGFKYHYLGATPIILIIPVGLIFGCRRASRNRTRRRCVVTRRTVVIPRSTNISTRGPLGYTRFDDSNIQVPMPPGASGTTGAPPGTTGAPPVYTPFDNSSAQGAKPSEAPGTTDPPPGYTPVDATNTQVTSGGTNQAASPTLQTQ